MPTPGPWDYDNIAIKVAFVALIVSGINFVSSVLGIKDVIPYCGKWWIAKKKEKQQSIDRKKREEIERIATEWHIKDVKFAARSREVGDIQVCLTKLHQMLPELRESQTSAQSHDRVFAQDSRYSKLYREVESALKKLNETEHLYARDMALKYLPFHTEENIQAMIKYLEPPVAQFYKDRDAHLCQKPSSLILGEPPR